MCSSTCTVVTGRGRPKRRRVECRARLGGWLGRWVRCRAWRGSQSPHQALLLALAQLHSSPAGQQTAGAALLLSRQAGAASPALQPPPHTPGAAPGAQVCAPSVAAGPPAGARCCASQGTPPEAAAGSTEQHGAALSAPALPSQGRQAGVGAAKLLVLERQQQQQQWHEMWRRHSSASSRRARSALTQPASDPSAWLPVPPAPVGWSSAAGGASQSRRSAR